MPTHPRRLGLTLGLTLAALTLPLAACGDDDDGGADSSTGPPPAGAVQVVASDGLQFDSDEYTAPAGDVTFVYSGGNIQHSLVVEGHEDDMRLLIQGDEDQGELTLDAGEYIIYCDIAGHRAAGMEAALLVE